MIHENSLFAHPEEQSSGKLGKRSAMILEFFRDYAHQFKGFRCSDRQVMQGLHFTDMNAVRPHLSELIKSGHLEECGSMPDPDTGKRVRLVRLKQGQQRLF